MKAKDPEEGHEDMSRVRRSLSRRERYFTLVVCLMVCAVVAMVLINRKLNCRQVTLEQFLQEFQEDAKHRQI